MARCSFSPTCCENPSTPFLILSTYSIFPGLIHKSSLEPTCPDVWRVSVCLHRLSGSFWWGGYTAPFWLPRNHLNSGRWEKDPWKMLKTHFPRKKMTWPFKGWPREWALWPWEQAPKLSPFLFGVPGNSGVQTRTNQKRACWEFPASVCLPSCTYILDIYIYICICSGDCPCSKRTGSAHTPTSFNHPPNKNKRKCAYTQGNELCGNNW